MHSFRGWWAARPFGSSRPKCLATPPARLPIESWLGQDWDGVVLQHAMATLVPQHLDEVKAEREIRARMQREINHWSRRYAELQLQEQASKQVRLPAQVARERADVLVSRRMWMPQPASGWSCWR